MNRPTSIVCRTKIHSENLEIHPETRSSFRSALNPVHHYVNNIDYIINIKELNTCIFCTPELGD